MIGYRPFGPWWGWLGLGSFVLFWGLVAVALVLLFRYLSQRGQPPRAGGSFWQAGPPPGAPPYPPQGRQAAEHILAERFARGEIDEEEYRRRLTVLRSEPPYPGGPASQSPPPGGDAAPPEPPTAQQPPAAP